MIEINKEYLDEVSKGRIHHKYYDKTVKHAEQMGVHVEGETPDALLRLNRPNEQPEIREYRLKSYEPVTQSLSEKVINTVNKIFNPRLWSFKFPEMSGTVGEDTLEKYLTEDYPFYRSIMNFITETFTQKDFSDPNGAIVIIPKNWEIDETELYEPIAVIYDSESLVDFKDEQYYTFSFGDVVKVFTKNEIFYYKQRVSGGDTYWDLVFEYEHGFGFVPVFRLGGIIKGKKTPYYYESWIRGVLPHWNQVVQLTSDLQAAYMNHLYMDKWEFTKECEAPGCNDGVIEVEVLDGKEAIMTNVNCKTCLGTGKVSRNPYGIHTINRDALNPDAPLPTPPAGYIDKPIDVVDKVEDRIKKEEKRGLSSINMEIVQMVGEDQSGVAKTVDREDLNSFLSRYARHVFEYVLPNLIMGIAAWRYSVTDRVVDILPEISAPKDFNILNLNQLSTEYKDASNSNVSAAYLQHIEGEIVQSKFANNEEARKKNEAIIKLQPFPGKSVDDMLTLQNLSQPEWKVYKAISIIELVEMAIEDNEDFLNKSLKEQREVIDEMAKEAVGFVDGLVSVPSPSSDVLLDDDISLDQALQSDEAVDAEAEAKARLKGSVGGVQGILQIQQSVASGVTERSAAVELLDQIFGFDTITAEKLLGKPSRPNNDQV